MEESTPWVQTRVAVKEFMQLLSCKKCEQRPTDPVCYTTCSHSFCSSCVYDDTNCFTCGIPVQPQDKRRDHVTAGIVSACDTIIDIIFADGYSQDESESEEEIVNEVSTEAEVHREVEVPGEEKENHAKNLRKDEETEDQVDIVEGTENQKEIVQETEDPGEIVEGTEIPKDIMEEIENPREIVEEIENQLDIVEDTEYQGKKSDRIKKSKECIEQREIKKTEDQIEPEDKTKNQDNKYEKSEKCREDNKDLQKSKEQEIEKQVENNREREDQMEIEEETDDEGDSRRKNEKQQKHREDKKHVVEKYTEEIENYVEKRTENTKNQIERNKENKENDDELVGESENKMETTGKGNKRKKADTQKNAKRQEFSKMDESEVVDFHNEDLLSSTRMSTNFVNTRQRNAKNPTVIKKPKVAKRAKKVETVEDDTVIISTSDEIFSSKNTESNTLASTSAKSKSTKLTARKKRSNSLNETQKVPKNVDKKNKKGESLLHQACLKKQEETVKSLLDLGANPNTKDNANWTPLQEAVSLGLYRICEMLLEKGALPNTPGIDNKTALHEAVISDKIQEAELLLRYDANPNVFDQNGKRPVDYCLSDKMRKLLSQGNLNDTRDRLSDLSCSLSRSIGQRITKIVVLACNLQQSTKASLSTLAAKHKFKIVNNFLPTVTHVVVESEQTFFPNYDLLLSILHGKWILSSEWIEIGLSPECKDLTDMDLDIFEMKFLSSDDAPKRARLNAEMQNPKLFNNCYFYFALSSVEEYPLGQTTITKKNLMNLCTEGGGTILTREPNPEDIKDQLIPFHVADDKQHPLHNCSHYIIYLPGKDRIMYKMPHIKTLPLVWFIECIERFTLVEPVLYGIE